MAASEPVGMSRRGFLQGSAAAALLAARGRAGEAPAKRPNVLFIAADDLRPQLGCYGDAFAKTPHVDRLAARGIVFSRAYCQQALCSPSRISLMTGRRPASTRIYSIGPALRETMPDVVTLPQLFKNHGWFTRSLGKVYHIGIDDPASWSVPSFVSKKPRYGPEGAAAVRKYVAEMKAAGKELPKKGKGMAFYAGPAFEAPDLADDELTDGDTAREAVAALADFARKPDQPFFLAVGFVNPHVPYVAPKRYFDLYQPEKLVLPGNTYPPRNAPAFAAKTGQDFLWYGNIPKDQKITPEFGRKALHGYLAAISYVDAQVGRLLDALEKSGLAENTIVMFWGDNGYYMGEHGWWGSKHNCYEGATRVPLIVAAPGMKAAGQRTDALVELVDMYPTLAELAGLPQPEGLEGTSFAPLLAEPRRPWKTAAFSQYPMGGHLGTAMRTDRYRYVEWADKAGQVAARELYDHEADPQENENVAGKAENAALLDRLANQLAAGWRAAQPPRP